MKLISFLSQPFTLIDNPKQKLLLISFCLGFGILFTNVFIPFNVNQWEQDSGISQFLRLTSYCLIFAISLFITQFIIRRIFRVNTFVIWSFILWFLGEVVFISVIYLFIYSDTINVLWESFIFSFQHTLLGILIPYLFALTILSLIKYKSTKHVVMQEGDNLVGIPDEKGAIKVTLKLSSILYLESADNYITVFYLDEAVVKRKLIRNSLKKLELKFSNSNLKRCHRSYMVNLKNIKLIEKESRKSVIHINNCKNPIPISANYISQF